LTFVAPFSSLMVVNQNTDGVTHDLQSLPTSDLFEQVYWPTLLKKEELCGIYPTLIYSSILENPSVIGSANVYLCSITIYYYMDASRYIKSAGYRKGNKVMVLSITWHAMPTDLHC
jgi:hypothetical protein